ncbi:EF-hand domain-containing protein [Candidatus Thiothrix sp. Deng01]|uniref:EF-hand domain-containing protein n=1 Tax=Candidatus Thiothrix phosphatis TaxID=3112415 RepID=A0ABU6CV20_9GAMM|nr:EF-hand domain-containing protein [Candidatus Thiothrix sp. Deng01]MEB4590685.1 EF-hand domain-containing protein [Candidatus Thiothrix sp. Deng01]
MWMWLRILLPELGGFGSQPQGDRNGLDWRQVMDNQRLAVLRRGGIMNLAAAPGFAVAWVGCAYWLYRHADPQWLLVPATLSLLFAIGLFRRYRLIVDTPTSRLSSGAQGYVELNGVAALPDGEGFRGLPHLPVTVWLPGYVEDEPFVLDDGHGRCLLYPRQAEIVTRPGDTHFSWLKAIYPGQTLYVLGELRTQRASGLQQERRERIAAVLADWKHNQRQLLENFDANGNGQIDPEEWQAVRAAAERWVEEDIREQQRVPGTHVMDGARGGQLFLITNIPPEELARHYRWAAFLHLLGWLAVLVWLHLG